MNENKISRFELTSGEYMKRHFIVPYAAIRHGGRRKTSSAFGLVIRLSPSVHADDWKYVYGAKMHLTQHK